MDKIYSKAFEDTFSIEQGYANVAADRGKETYGGVSRRYWPDWEGWKIIDGLKSRPDFPSCLKKMPEIKQTLYILLKKFYYENFWKTTPCARIAEIDPHIAIELFDTAVNSGEGTASKILQKALNLLNRNQSLYSDLIVDGKVGNVTMDAIKKLLKTDKNLNSLFIWMNLLQGNNFIEIMKNDPTQETFARGWIKRIKITKEPISFD